MSLYLSVDFRYEAKQRIRSISALRENKKDLEAELSVIYERNPLIHTRGSGDTKIRSTGNNTSHVSISLSEREKVVERRLFEINAIINDFERAWNMLDPLQKKVLEMRFQNNMTQRAVAKEIGYSIRQLQNIENKALLIVESELLRV